MGRASPLDSVTFERFKDFVFTLRYPPNPARPLNNQLTGLAAIGETIFMNDTSVTPINLRCVDCHALPTGTSGLSAHLTQLGDSHTMKIPHLRNAYDKGGRFQSHGAPGEWFRLCSRWQRVRRVSPC